ncbi:hypothetical protein NC796_06895 [Aliifodinibius sp. S!AR15-10]|uniref:hypothetical protein n=1 Tax=Aliifodinibius sp. S!AR15-10 TaxID=2950437 RepID=UPI00286380AE|nr:hypothetical protein [Aliifodinibius sp. S!AR15-10]MDR8390856.1 hypothetical protein [Aliifodinibius sp. S!AR15-10]
MIRRCLISCLLVLATVWHCHAQQINFGDYGNYSLSTSELNTGDIDFGQIISGSGTNSIDINNAKIIEIVGVKYLDVIVEITADNDLYLNGNTSYAGDSQKSIPLTLEAAYANNAGTPTIGQAKIINVPNNNFTTRFPILERQSQPPGPPPPPPTNAFDQSKVEETAYFYIYGSINVGDVDAGFYSGQITVTVSYD